MGHIYKTENPQDTECSYLYQSNLQNLMKLIVKTKRNFCKTNRFFFFFFFFLSILLRMTERNCTSSYLNSTLTKIYSMIIIRIQVVYNTFSKESSTNRLTVISFRLENERSPVNVYVFKEEKIYCI